MRKAETPQMTVALIKSSIFIIQYRTTRPSAEVIALDFSPALPIRAAVQSSDPVLFVTFFIRFC
jgi:hypothetical protein